MVLRTKKKGLGYRLLKNIIADVYIYRIPRRHVVAAAGSPRRIRIIQLLQVPENYTFYTLARGHPAGRRYTYYTFAERARPYIYFIQRSPTHNRGAVSFILSGTRPYTRHTCGQTRS